MKARKTAAMNENIVTLRAALFTPTGKDKDVTEGISPAFLKYDRNGLDVLLKFSDKLTSKVIFSILLYIKPSFFTQRSIFCEGINMGLRYLQGEHGRTL